VERVLLRVPLGSRWVRTRIQRTLRKGHARIAMTGDLGSLRLNIKVAAPKCDTDLSRTSKKATVSGMHVTQFE
jgi:hypothetical protein